MAYDPQNVFAKILRKEIPSRPVYEDTFTYAFHDINPQAPIHVLIIPKGEYTCWEDFAAHATPEETVAFVKAVKAVAATLGVTEDGYRILSNIGKNGMQEVPHLHIHLLAGCPLGTKIVNPAP